MYPITTTNPIIIDTDPGIDDAIAIIVALAYNRNIVSTIISSYGNISVAKTTKNTISMLKLCNCCIPVIMGTQKPDNDKYVEAANIHGEDGLGGLFVETGDISAYEGDYIKRLYDTILKEGMVDYIVLGPLTNLALLIKRFPDALNYIGRVVVMGGGFDMGNVTEDAEFNIHCDAESADYIFSTVENLTLVPLNATTPVSFSLEEIADIEKAETSLASACGKILTANYHNCTKNGENGSTMHDATAVIYYLNPSLFETEKYAVGVDCGNSHYGKTMKFDVKNVANATILTDIVVRCDPKIVKDYITDSIKSFC